MGVTYGLPSATPADVWSYGVRRLGVPTPIDIRLDGGTTQLLTEGTYIAAPMDDAYAAENWGSMHLEVLAGGAWRNFTVSDATRTFGSIFHSDGVSLRAANSLPAAQFTRLVGVKLG